MQPEIAGKLRDRKIKNIKSTKPDIIAAGNIGCITQIANGMAADGANIPIVHTIELLNWVYGGEVPALVASNGLDQRVTTVAEAAE